MKVQQFKKRILMEGGIGLAVVAVLAIVAYFINVISTEYSENNTVMHSKVDTISEDLSSLQKQYAFVTQNPELYQELKQKQADGRLFISRQLMFEKFNQFRSQLDLSNLRLSVAAVQEIKNPQFKRKTNMVNSSDASVDLDVLYDENIYELLNAMQRELSGICVISKLNMALQKPVDASVLQTIGVKGTYPLVKTTIKFNWYSINPVEPSDASDDATKK